MLNPGIGSAAMVPAPVPSDTVARFGLLNVTVKFSLLSDTASCSIGTRMVCVVP